MLRARCLVISSRSHLLRLGVHFSRCLEIVLSNVTTGNFLGTKPNHQFLNYLHMLLFDKERQTELSFASSCLKCLLRLGLGRQSSTYKPEAPSRFPMWMAGMQLSCYQRLQGFVPAGGWRQKL